MTDKGSIIEPIDKAAITIPAIHAQYFNLFRLLITISMNIPKAININDINPNMKVMIITALS